MKIPLAVYSEVETVIAKAIDPSGWDGEQPDERRRSLCETKRLVSLGQARNVLSALDCAGYQVFGPPTEDDF